MTQAKVDPDSVALRAQPTPVMRLSRRTLAILTGRPGRRRVRCHDLVVAKRPPQRHGAHRTA